MGGQVVQSRNLALCVVEAWVQIPPHSPHKSSTSMVEVFIVLLFLPSPLVCNSLFLKRTNVRGARAAVFIICLQIKFDFSIDKLIRVWYNIYRKKERG